MIPRYQRIAYWVLVGGALLMALLLLRGCVRTHRHIAEMRDESPIPAPVESAEETATIAHANDTDGTVTLEPVTLALPKEPSLRARTLLERALAESAGPGSAHPIPSGPAIADVYFVPLPLHNTPNTGQGEAQQADSNAPSPYGHDHIPDAVLAVVNLTKPFADAHPSGVEAEDLTLKILLATLHSNFPEVEQVRFLVDGAGRETLAGHAELTRPYPLFDPTQSIHPLAADGSQE